MVWQLRCILARRAAELCMSGSLPSTLREEIRHDFADHLRFSTALSRAIVALPALAYVAVLWPTVLNEIFTATRVPDAANLLGC